MRVFMQIGIIWLVCLLLEIVGFRVAKPDFGRTLLVEWIWFLHPNSTNDELREASEFVQPTAIRFAYEA